MTTPPQVAKVVRPCPFWIEITTQDLPSNIGEVRSFMVLGPSNGPRPWGILMVHSWWPPIAPKAYGLRTVGPQGQQKTKKGQKCPKAMKVEKSP
ncbi:hypothetical protein O181_009780 [Austropuccinia psidii MF-1]|uniref:Uncharacterized protein n=1 Tax=Austropuccinia psidii MF-1 TaxID=1389203 RepID=A0A9Q3GK87_9BASI|nr:hypothetical protein [Austropuccinia psidii MF-1]